MKYKIRYSGRFKKSYKLCMRRGLDAGLFETVVQLLAETGTLPAKFHPHKLTGNWRGIWECHIQPNWLLLWEQDDDELTLLLLETGTHADIF